MYPSLPQQPGQPAPSWPLGSGSTPSSYPYAMGNHPTTATTAPGGGTPSVQLMQQYQLATTATPHAAYPGECLIAEWPSGKV